MESTGEIQVVASAETAAGGLECVKQFAPDLGVFDLGLPDHSGIWLINKVRAIFPDLPILVLSMHSEVEIIASVLRAGADGYLGKSTDAKTLQSAIRSVVEGEKFLTDSVRERLGELAADEVLTGARLRFSQSHEKLLDGKELRVLNLVAQGASNAEVAKSLGVSMGTVKARLSVIFQKLGVETRTEAVALALNQGILGHD